MNKKFNLPEAGTYFFLCFTFFILLQYIMTAGAVTIIAFYALLLPAFLYYAYCEKAKFFGTLRENKILLALFTYIIIQTLVFALHNPKMLKYTGHAFCTLIFILAAITFFKLPQERVHKLFFWGTIIALIAAVYSLIRYYPPDTCNISLIPIGRANHQILGASVFATMGLLALHLLHGTHIKTHRSFFCAIIIIIGALVVATQSRGPMISYITCLFIATYLYAKNAREMWLGFTLIIVCSIALIAIMNASISSLECASTLVSRGSTHRFELWQMTIAKILTGSFWGYGMDAKLEHPATAYPHNIFLATTLYLGIPGITGLITLISACLVSAFKKIKTPVGKLALVLVLHAILSGMTDHSHLIKAPAPLYIIFWLPLSLALTLRSGPQKA